MWIHEWLRSIDIISGRNSTQAASNNKYADKWAVNMYEHLTVDLFNLHPPMALNANSFGLHVVSRKYTLMCNFLWPCGTMRHELGWIAIECHNCCMNGRNLWIINIPSSSPILDVPTFEQCNLSSRTNQSRTSTSINHFLVNFNRPTCRTQEIVNLPTSQPLGRILRIWPLDLWLLKIKEWCPWGIMKHGYDAPLGLSHENPSSKTIFLSDVNEASLSRPE